MNTRILEAQLAEAVEDDLRRQNVNSAKLRASSQAVPYEQFKQFVGTIPRLLAGTRRGSPQHCLIISLAIVLSECLAQLPRICDPWIRAKMWPQ